MRALSQIGGNRERGRERERGGESEIKLVVERIPQALKCFSPNQRPPLGKCYSLPLFLACVTCEETNSPSSLISCPAISTAIQSSNLKSHDLHDHLQQNHHSTPTSEGKKKFHHKAPNKHTSSTTLPSLCLIEKEKGYFFL